jgi:23S rRNA (guanosine2251-2'-O)-methyltransferase
MNRSLVLVAHNLRSSHNVGSLLRTAEGLGVKTVYLTGYTPYPIMAGDTRLPHLANKVDRQISKTALGAEISQNWQHQDDITQVLSDLRAQGYKIAGLEQTPQAQELPSFKTPDKLAIILGREVEGIELEVLKQTDLQLVIPMFGQKESFNVVQAAAMALYHCRFA